MPVMPTVTPVTNPVVAPIVATAGLLLVHVPAPAASARAVVPPTQTEVVPEMGDIGFTVTTAVV